MADDAKSGVGILACLRGFGSEDRLPSLRLPLFSLTALFLAGCMTSPTTRQVGRPTGDPVVDDQSRLAAAPAKDKVLWEYKLAAAAVRRGQFNEARMQLDAARRTTDGILDATGPDTAAASSRGLFHPEADKPFVGEPYERIMADFYRGLIYWRDGEPDNARALFRSGSFLAGGSADKPSQGGWVLLDYLDGFVTARLHGDGGDALARARARSAHPLPDYDLGANTMIFAEYGPGPIKYATGQYRQQLKIYLSEPVTTADARIVVEGRTIDLMPWDDVGMQATMRAGRVMDQILGNKAEFKQVTDLVGDAALAGAAGTAALGRGRRTGEAAALALAGVTSKLVSAATQPAADIRAWDNLPRYLSFAALRLSPGTHAATLTFYDLYGHARPDVQTFTITVPESTAAPGAPSSRDTIVFCSELTE